MIHQVPPGPRTCRGFSVVELMVAVLIGLFILGGVVQVVVSSKRSYLDQEEMSFIQNNARYAVDVISRDVKMAGYMGCASEGSVQIANSIRIDLDGFISTQGLQGFEGEVTTSGFPIAYRDDALAGTDSFIVRRAAEENELAVKDHKAASAVIDIWGDNNYQQGTTLMIVDASCRHMGVFQVSSDSTNKKIGHNPNNGNGNLANNCTKIIKGNFDCSASQCNAVSCGGYTHTTGKYGPGAKIMKFIAHAYYIGNSSSVPGMPALKRQSLTTDSISGATTITEELAVGVEDMELIYGADTNADGEVDQYFKASQMDIDGNGAIDDDDWRMVLSVRVNLLFRSRAEVFASDQAVTFDGAAVSGKYMRQSVSSTIQLRNRG